MMNLLVIGSIVGFGLSVTASTQAEAANESHFLMDEDSSVALDVNKGLLTIQVFHKQSDGVRCGLKLVGEKAVGDKDVAGVADRLEIRQDGVPLAAKAGGEFLFSRTILFMSKVEVSTKSGRSLRNELDAVLGKDARVFVAAKDCETPQPSVPSLQLASMRGSR